MSNKIGMQIGGISKQGVEAVEKAILSILTAPAEQKTISAALETLTALAAPTPITNASLNNNYVDMRDEHPPAPAMVDPADHDEDDGA